MPSHAPDTAQPAKHPFHRSAKIVLTAALTLAAGAAPMLVPTPATADTPVVVDGFDRSVTSGWGTAATGSAWADMIGGSSSSVSGSEGRVTNILAGRSFRAYQKGVNTEEAEVRADFTVPAAANFIYTIEARKQADLSAYFGRARIDPQGKLHIEVMRSNAGALTMLKEMTLETPVPVGQRLVLKLSTKGEAPVVVQGKVFVAGSTEPGWQVTALDTASNAITTPGYAGVQAYNGGGNPAVTVATQAFSVTDVTPAPEPPAESPQPSTSPSTPTTSPSPSPTAPTATPTTPTVDPTPVTPPKLAVRHGAGVVGSAAYTPPSDALYVSPTGNDLNPGTLDRPLKTVTKAVNKNYSGQTIVLRAGTYHESVIVPPNHAATIQPYPNEAVWFDGTRAVSGFAASGNGFVAGGWTTEFDASPTYTKGAPDGTAAGWQFINPSYPMAAHPDMVWIDNVEQRQVKTLADLVPGTFYVDYPTDKLYLGSDPTGKSVRASDLGWAFSLRAPGTVLRGFGIRRFANSVWQQGVVTAYYERMTLDNMTVLDSATGGIGFYKPNSVIKNTTVDGSGQIGIQAGFADNLLLDNVSVTDSNDERFNPAPAAGGIKITTTRGVTIKNSEFLRTLGNQIWTDQSVYDTTLAGNEILNGNRWGVVLEISSTATVVNNIIAGNAHDGIMVQNTDKVKIWNNTIVNNRRAIAVVQDSRRIEQLSVSGHDPRRPQPDLSMPWVIGNSTIGNNIMAAGTTANSVLAVESYELAFDASELNITTNGNVYSQVALGVPNAAAVWARKGFQPYHFTLLDDFRGNTGQEATSINPLVLTPVDTAYQPKSTVTSKVGVTAQPLPADVALRAGRTAGEKYLGAFSRPTA